MKRPNLRLSNPDQEAIDDIADFQTVAIDGAPPELDAPHLEATQLLPIPPAAPNTYNRDDGAVMEETKPNEAVALRNAPPSSEEDKKNLKAQAKKFGQQDGQGKRAFVQFARLLVRGGMAKTLVPSPKSQDASEFYNAFASGSKDATGGIADNNKASTAAQISKVRAFIRLGQKFKEDGEAIFDRALEMHKHIMRTPELVDRVKLRSTYSAVCSVAVAQCKPEANEIPLSDEQIRNLLINEPVEEVERTGAHVLLSALNLVESAMRGRETTEKTTGRAAITHPDLPLVVAALRTVIGSVDQPALDQRDAAIIAIRQHKAEKAEAKAKKEAEDKAKKERKERDKAIQAQVANEEYEGDVEETEE